MKLEKAKEILENIDIDVSGVATCKECILKDRKTCFENGKDCQKEAIETVLQSLDNSISKDKVIEEIKELNKKLDEPNNDRWEKDDNNYYNIIKAQIKILNKLLEDK